MAQPYPAASAADLNFDLGMPGWYGAADFEPPDHELFSRNFPYGPNDGYQDLVPETAENEIIVRGSEPNSAYNLVPQTAENGSLQSGTAQDSAPQLPNRGSLSETPPASQSASRPPPIRRGRGRGLGQGGRVHVESRADSYRRANIVRRKYYCGEHRRAFGTSNDLKRHNREVHGTNPDGNPTEQFSCPWNNCPRHRRGFTRLYNFNQHLNSVHRGRLPNPQDNTITDDVNVLEGNADENMAGSGPQELPSRPQPSSALPAKINSTGDAVEPVNGAETAAEGGPTLSTNRDCLTAHQSPVVEPLDEMERSNERLVAFHGICTLFKVILPGDAAMLAAKEVEIKCLQDECQKLEAKLQRRMHEEQIVSQRLHQTPISQDAQGAIDAVRSQRHSQRLAAAKQLLEEAKNTYDEMGLEADAGKLAMRICAKKLAKERRQNR